MRKRVSLTTRIVGIEGVNRTVEYDEYSNLILYKEYRRYLIVVLDKDTPCVARFYGERKAKRFLRCMPKGVTSARLERKVAEFNSVARTCRYGGTPTQEQLNAL